MKTRLKKNITFLLFSIISFFLIFVARDEIFWKILVRERNYDIGNYELTGTQGMPLSCMYFCKDSKNKFLISKFGKTRNVQIEFLGCPLVEGDLAWCIWSNNTLSEEDYEKIIQKFNVNTGFGVFQYVYKNEKHKKNVLNYIFENSQIR